MRSTPSWKWLAPRFISRHLRQAQSGTRVSRRPPLAVERLESRNLLTANSAPLVQASEVPEVSDTQILIGLLTHSANVTQNEFELLETLADGPPVETEVKVKVHDISIIKSVDKATPILFQLNDTLIKVGQDVINGELTEKKVTEAKNKVDYLQVKLNDIIISSFNVSQERAEEILTPLFESADALINSLTDGGVSERKAGKGQQEFIRLSTEILKIEDLAIRGELDFLKAGSPGLDVQDFQVKIENVFQKAEDAVVKLQLDESDSAALKTAISDFQVKIENLLGGLGGGVETDVGSLGAHGKFKGGIFMPPTDDTIT